MAKGKHEAVRQRTRPADTKRIVITVALGILLAAMAATLILFAVKWINAGEDELITPPVAPDPPVVPEPVTPEEPEEPETPEEPEEPDPPVVPDEPEEPDEPDEPEPPEEPEYTGPVDPLTGLPVDKDISQERPFAVMLNNIEKAVPQAGVGEAKMIIEALAEGGITRLMGIYGSLDDIETLGSIRSSRPYFVDMALGFDAVYIHAGGSEDAYTRLQKSKIAHLDGVNSSMGEAKLFYRDSWRQQNMGYAHSLMLKASEVSAFLEEKSIRLTHKEGFDAGFRFGEAERTGDTAQTVTVRYGTSKGSKYTTFKYDADSKLYSVSQYGGAMKDSVTGAQVKVRNVIVVSAKMSVIAGDSAGRMKATLTGSGEGLFFADGVAQKITWERSSDSSQFVFKDANGEILLLAPGVSYISIVPTYAVPVEYE